MNSENKIIAQRAFECSKKALEDGNYELAQIYMLNAMTHHSDLKYLSDYPKILEKLPVSERNSYLDQAIDLYSVALYNNPPEETLQIIELIDNLKKMIVETGNDTPPDDESGDDESAAAQAFAELEAESRKYAWKTLIETNKNEDIDALSARMDFYNKVLQAGAALSPQNLTKSQKQLLDNAAQELQDTKTVVEYVSIKNSAEQYLEEAKKELNKPDYNSQYVVSRLQQTTTLLSQLWLFDVVSTIGQETYLTQLNALQKASSDLEKEFLEKESAPMCRNIREEIAKEIKKIDSVDSPYDDRGNRIAHRKFTPQINISQRRYGEIATRIAEIPLKSKALEMQGELQKLAEKINELSKKRYAAYQKKCAEICRQAIQNFEDITWVWEKDAQKILEDNPIHTINEALISPETATILQMTKQILEDKLTRINKADFAVKCIEAEKMKLEEF